MAVITANPHKNPGSLGRWQVQTFALLWGAYASYYLARLNFAVAQPLILLEFKDWSAAQVGLIPSVYAMVYAIGQFINGQLGERYGARRMMTVAMIVATIANLGFSQTSSFAMMLVFWGLNGYAQSAGWSLVVKTISDWNPVRRRGMVIGLISTSYQVGNVLAWLLAGWVASSYGWRASFWVPSLILAPMTLLFVLGVRNKPQDVGFPQIREDGQEPANSPANSNTAGVADGPRVGMGFVLREMLANRLLWIMAIGFFSMNSVRYAFMNWSVTYMSDFHGQDIKNSAFKAVALPLIGSVGAVLAGWMSDTLFKGRRAPLVAIMLFLLAVLCVVFPFVPKGDWVLATALLGLAGFLIYGPDMLLSGAATVDVHPQAAAAGTGFIMATGAAGSIISGAGIGWIKDMTPGFIAGLESKPVWMTEWTLVFFFLAILSLIPAALMVSIWNIKPR